MQNLRYYQTFLNEEYRRRVSGNPRYSLRAFAKLLDLDHSNLSRVLLGKRSLSILLATGVADRLQLGEQDRKLFLSSVVEEKTNGAPIILRLETRAARTESLNDAHPVELDSFALISQWHHYAILELTKVRKFDPDPAWIADRLGLPIGETREAIDRLLRLGLLIRTSKNRLKKKSAWVETRDQARTTVAHKAHQRQFLEKSSEALQSIPLERRAHYTSMLAVDPSKLDRAKELIRKFTEEMNQLVTAPVPKEVYWLGVSLVPLTEIETQEKPHEENDRKVG